MWFKGFLSPYWKERVWGKEGIIRQLHHQETLHFQHHVDESSIEGRTRQASRQEEIQPQSQGEKWRETGWKKEG